MLSLRWVLSRAAAALVGAALVGVVAALVIVVVDALTCGPSCFAAEGRGDGPMRCVSSWNSCSTIGPRLLWFYVINTPLFSVPLGVLPGFAALTLTPAAKHPWRSLPVLVCATVLGFCLWLPLNKLVPAAFAFPAQGLLTLFIIPSVTGFIAAINIERIPPRLRLMTG